MTPKVLYSLLGKTPAAIMVAPESPGIRITATLPELVDDAMAKALICYGTKAVPFSKAMSFFLMFRPWANPVKFPLEPTTR